MSDRLVSTGVTGVCRPLQLSGYEGLVVRFHATPVPEPVKLSTVSGAMDMGYPLQG